MLCMTSPVKNCTNCGQTKAIVEFPAGNSRCGLCGPWIPPEWRDYLAKGSVDAQPEVPEAA